MIKRTQLALGIAATLGVAAFTSTSVSANELSNLKARIAKLERAEVTKSASDNGNMVFFRAGFASNSSDRYGDILTDTIGGAGVVTQANGDKDGAYFGAGFDFSLNDDLFGFHDGTEVLAEIMFEYKEYQKANLAVAALPTVANTTVTGTLTAGANGVTVSQFTLSAAPKVKFLKGSKFRPWIIPMGFSMHVISPPSDGVTVLKPSMMFAFGADYNLWKSVYVGADFRYHVSVGENDLDGVDTDGLTTGVSLGIGF